MVSLKIVNVFSEGKDGVKNEDYFESNENCFVIADGATDKSGKKYDDKTGGEIVSRLVTKECLAVDLDGTDLVNYLNGKIRELYGQLNISEDVKDPKFRFSCGFICARIKGNKIIITYLGDLGFRINGRDVYRQTKKVDIINAEERAKYIQETGDLAGARKHVLPLILKQFDYQNQLVELGYGVLDGIETPSRFVKVFEYDADKIQILELFTDGYFDVPKETTITAWEDLYNQIEAEDPDKWKKYKSTKSKDDRTIVIIELQKV